MTAATITSEEARITSVEAARARRAASAQHRGAQSEWFIDEVSNTIALDSRQRVRLATEYLKNKIIVNISRPVTKTVVTGVTGRRSTQVSDRSKKGEFPKADTTQLLKTIFSDYGTPEPGVFEGYIGTPLDYGLILETSVRFDRSFLVRTFREEIDRVVKILTGPTTL